VARGGADNLAPGIKRNLALEINNLTVALDDGHRERPEWRPNVRGIEGVDHPVSFGCFPPSI
jgi:hypothetical protein